MFSDSEFDFGFVKPVSPEQIIKITNKKKVSSTELAGMHAWQLDA